MSERPLPLPDAATAFFWDGAREGRLMILRCNDCGTYLHPPRPVCRSCASSRLAPAHVSGRGTVYSFTVTHRAVPGFTTPFAVALVELEEQAGLRLVTNLAGVAPEDTRIGMEVEVVFEQVAGGVTLPLFAPRSRA